MLSFTLELDTGIRLGNDLLMIRTSSVTLIMVTARCYFRSFFLLNVIFGYGKSLENQWR